ncbi:MAG: cardiolipin synthase [Bacteroidales bacterium]|nr:cardiolipin synthase [Bacteroidales bacterium]
MCSVDPRYQPLVQLLSEEARPGVTSGNNIEIFTKGTDKLKSLLKDISEAKEYIHFQYYLFGKDVSSLAVREALIKKAKEGVKVRILHENIANYDTRRGFYNEMRKYGVELIRIYRPSLNPVKLILGLNRRNHRKIVVIDGRIGYTGGMNIKDRYFTHWRDTHLRITGPAVSSLQRIFLDGWKEVRGRLDRPEEYYYPVSTHPSGEVPGDGILKDKLVQVTPDGPYSKKAVLQQSYVWAIRNAKDYFWLQTPYFVPPADILQALKDAAARGVDVRVMVPMVPETVFLGYAIQSYYKECLNAGIRIFERGGGFIHSKTFIADDYLSSIGSANLDNRSFAINYEVNTYMYDRETALRNIEIFNKDLEISREVNPADWQRVSLKQRVLQWFFRLFARQL